MKGLSQVCASPRKFKPSQAHYCLILLTILFVVQINKKT
jgi:hypothetical protein